MPKNNERVLVTRKDLVKLLAYNRQVEEKHYEELKNAGHDERSHIWHTIKRLAKQAEYKFT